MTDAQDATNKAVPGSDGAAPDHEGRDVVRALLRGLAVIESFEGAMHPSSLAEVASRVGLSRGTTRRVLITLQASGYVVEERGRFSLSSRVLRLGYAHLSSQPAWALARPVAESLSRALGETVSMAVLSEGVIVYLLRVVAPRLLHDHLTIGSRMPAYPASMGRVLLAGLGSDALDRYFRETELRQLTPFTVVEEQGLRTLIGHARQDGYAINDQEMELGLRSVAVPLWASGKVAAALNVSVSAARVTLGEMVQNLLPPLQEAAASVSNLLTHAGF